MLNCRRCRSALLLALTRLGENDHTVYRCRSCGFLFSPPDGGGDGDADGGDGRAAPSGIIPSAPPLSALDVRQRQRAAAATAAAAAHSHTRRPAAR